MLYLENIKTGKVDEFIKMDQVKSMFLQNPFEKGKHILTIEYQNGDLKKVEIETNTYTDLFDTLSSHHFEKTLINSKHLSYTRSDTKYGK